MSWEQTPLSAVATIIMGQSPPGFTYNQNGQGLPFFQGVKDFGSRHPVGQIYCSHPTKVAEEGDTLFSVRAPIGRINRANQQCAIGRGLSIIRAKRKSDENFIEFLLRSMHKLWGIYESQGAIFGNMRKYDLENLKIVWPPEDERNRIASILSAYDDLIENNRRRIQLLEQAAELLYKEWFVHFRFPGHEHTAIVNGIPEGWKRRHLSDLVNTQYGFTESATAESVGPKFLRGTDINKTSYIDWSSVPFCSDRNLNFNKYSLQIGDIVVVRMADPGKVAIVETEQKAVFASYLVRLKRKSDAEIPILYLFYALSDASYQKFISSASGGSTRKSANAKLLVDFYISEPTKEVVNMFVEKVAPFRKKIQILLRQNESLRKARDLLLPRFMNRGMAI